MKIFVDTAKLSEIKAAVELGVCDGVTTNPSLIKAAMEELKMGMEEYIKDICRTASGNPVSLEVISTDAEEMIKEARILHNRFNNVADNVVVKIPIATATEDIGSSEGIKAISALSSMGIKTNATLVMTPEQAFLAAKAGATYVSPFAGRIDDYLRTRMGKKFDKNDYYPADGLSSNKSETDNGIVSGVDLVKKIVDIYKNYGMKTEIIAASLRNPRQVREVALAGAHIATIPFPVIIEMTKHPKTVEGIIKFSQDVVEEYKRIFESD